MKKYYAVFDTNVLVSSLLTTGLSLGRTPSKDDFLDVENRRKPFLKNTFHFGLPSILGTISKQERCE